MPPNTPTSTLTDTELLNWLEKNRATVEFHELLPNGEPWNRLWIVTQGVNPFTAKTLRAAIREAIRARARTLKQKRGQPPREGGD